MSSSQGNIFLTTENLAFSLPLIAVCSIYAYFYFVPLKFGIPILVGGFAIHQIRNQIKAHHEKKLQNMGQKELDDLALTLEEEEEDVADDAEMKKLRKKKYLVEQRLAAERRKAEKASKSNNNKKKNDDDDDDDDDGDITTFAKGSRATKKKN